MESQIIKNGNPPLVSVVMSVYNGEEYLRLAVDSIIQQTFEDYEFIIIDDGSTDTTLSILESYNDPRILILHEKNEGLTRSLNKAIKAARGKYIARQDADDISQPMRLEKQVAFLELHPDIAMVGSNFAFIDDAERVLSYSRLPLTDRHIKRKLPEACPFCHSSVVLRADVIKKVGLYREFFEFAQDYDMWLRISDKYLTQNLFSPLVLYRQSSSTITTQKILMQTLYAGIAADQACRRKRIGYDDIENGTYPKFPPLSSLPNHLIKRLIRHYSRDPKRLEADSDLLSDTDLLFLQRKIKRAAVFYRLKRWIPKTINSHLSYCLRFGRVW